MSEILQTRHVYLPLIILDNTAPEANLLDSGCERVENTACRKDDDKLTVLTSKYLSRLKRKERRTPDGVGTYTVMLLVHATLVSAGLRPNLSLQTVTSMFGSPPEVSQI